MTVKDENTGESRGYFTVSTGNNSDSNLNNIVTDNSNLNNIHSSSNNDSNNFHQHS
jgi:hypothetical protein